MEDQAFQLLLAELKTLKEDIKELRDSLSKLYFKIAVIAAASGIAGGKFVNSLPKLSFYVESVYKSIVG
jgi:hypothetical protein